MATRSVLVCDVCQADVDGATHRLRLSVRDATNPTDVRELGAALEACPGCLQDACAGMVASAVERARAVKPGVVSTFLVAVDVIPLRGGP
jgi:hypothetical protein